MSEYVVGKINTLHFKAESLSEKEIYHANGGCGNSGEVRVNFECPNCPKWINVKDRLPLNGHTILATDGKEMQVCWIDINFNYLFMINLRQQFKNVTHWCAIPELPKEPE